MDFTTNGLLALFHLEVYWEIIYSLVTLEGQCVIWQWMLHMIASSNILEQRSKNPKAQIKGMWQNGFFEKLTECQYWPAFWMFISFHLPHNSFLFKHVSNSLLQVTTGPTLISLSGGTFLFRLLAKKQLISPLVLVGGGHCISRFSLVDWAL